MTHKVLRLFDKHGVAGCRWRVHLWRPDDAAHGRPALTPRFVKTIECFEPWRPDGTVVRNVFARKSNGLP